MIEDQIEIVPGVTGVREFETSPAMDSTTGLYMTAKVRFDDVSRQYECDEIRIFRRDGEGAEITSETLRSVAVDRIVWTVARMSLLPTPTGDQQHKLRNLPNPHGQEPWGWKVPKGLANEGPTERVLKWVAHFYRYSTALRMQPTAAVQQAMGVSRATAGRWVSTARDRGYLGAAIHGRAGEVSPSA